MSVHENGAQRIGIFQGFAGMTLAALGDDSNI
jgi:hypothetical protein